MARLTEIEIFDCLESNFRKAAEHAEDLAKLPRKGPTYVQFREELKLIEGACRQAGAWRSDSRWFKIGKDMAKAHDLAGEWLRGIKRPGGGPRIPLAEGHKHPLFMRLAEILRAGAKKANEVKTKATGRVGTILPVMGPVPFRDTRPVHISVPPELRVRASGLIVPAGLA